jgi:hypothetical protein
VPQRAFNIQIARGLKPMLASNGPATHRNDGSRRILTATVQTQTSPLVELVGGAATCCTAGSPPLEIGGGTLADDVGSTVGAGHAGNVRSMLRLRRVRWLRSRSAWWQAQVQRRSTPGFDLVAGSGAAGLREEQQPPPEGGACVVGRAALHVEFAAARPAHVASGGSRGGSRVVEP